MDNIHVGAYGWDNESWQRNYYPEDLPKDWRLDFYANSYRVTLVPETEWLSWDNEQIEETEDAVEGAFYFYFEVLLSSLQPRSKKSVDATQQLKKIIASLESKMGGVVVVDDLQEDEGDIKLANSILGCDVTLVSNCRVLEGWQWEHKGLTCSGNPCGVVASLSEDAKQQAALMQDFESSLPKDNKGSALFIKDSRVDMNQLSNLKTIAEILGY